MPPTRHLEVDDGELRLNFRQALERGAPAAPIDDVETELARESLDHSDHARIIVHDEQAQRFVGHRRVDDNAAISRFTGVRENLFG